MRCENVARYRCLLISEYCAPAKHNAAVVQIKTESKGWELCLHEALTLHAAVERCFFSVTVWTELKLTWLFSSGHTVTVTGNWQGSMCSKIKVCFVLTLADCFHVTLPWLSASQLLLVTVTVGFHYRAVVTPWSSTRDPEIPTSLLWPPFCIDFAWGVTKFQA